MSFFEVINKYENVDLKYILSSTGAQEVEAVLNKDTLNDYDFLTLLSPAAFLCRPTLTPMVP